MLNDIGQVVKDKHYMISIYVDSKKNNRDQICGCQKGNGGKWKVGKLGEGGQRV